jgi:predicted phage terminase large subunit-like protein
LESTLSKYELIASLKAELSRRRFWSYCLHYDKDFFDRRPFLQKPAEDLQWLFDEYKAGRSVKVGISLPPRSGKSYLVSLFCSWWLGNLPELAVMRNTCTKTLYNKFSYDVRAIIRSDTFKSVFPDVELAYDKQNIDGWNLVKAKQVSYFGAGVGGTIIGFGANVAISDDLYKDIEVARSVTQTEGIDAWKQSAHNSRMERNCPEIFIGTRWSKSDVIGKAQEKGQIDRYTSIPALTADGKSFCEDVKSTQEYIKVKEDTDEEIWSAEYMQDPIEIKGLLFPKSELRFYRPADVDLTKAEYKFAYVDPADEGGDYNAAPFCYLIGNRIYIADVVCNQSGTDVNIPDLVERIVVGKLNGAEVEGNSAWILFGKDLRTKVQARYPSCEIRVIKNTTNKQTRIIAQSAFIKHHMYFPEDYERHPQFKAFINWLTKYMRQGENKIDDPPDSLAGAAQHFKTRFPHLW